MKSLKSLKKATFVGLSSLVLVLGLFAAPAAFAKENGNSGDHDSDRNHRERRDDRRGDRDHRGDRNEDRNDRSETRE